MIAPDMDHARRVEGIGKAGIATNSKHVLDPVGLKPTMGSNSEGRSLILTWIVEGKSWV